ncbi:MAG TPA: extensin family protein [Amaricoccus sp.]|nr:extensin family protein [Amaricoccus sp.]
MSRYPLGAGLLLLLAGPLAAEPPRPLPAAAICGDPALVGSVLPAIGGEGGCGVGAPVSVAVAAGIVLEPPATVDCAVARGLALWLRRGPVPSLARRGAALEALVVVDAYACRNRNRAETGKLSEHARGRAIDVAGFRLRDGRTVTLAEGWRSPEWAGPLRRIHDAGCGPFATVLGPEANPLHADHLHLDAADRKSGPYCE